MLVKVEGGGMEVLRSEPEEMYHYVRHFHHFGPPHPKSTIDISELIHTWFHLTMITGDHKYNTNFIGHMMGTIDNQYYEAVVILELDSMDNEKQIILSSTNCLFLVLTS